MRPSLWPVIVGSAVFAAVGGLFVFGALPPLAERAPAAVPLSVVAAVVAATVVGAMAAGLTAHPRREQGVPRAGPVVWLPTSEARSLNVGVSFSPVSPRGMDVTAYNSVHTLGFVRSRSRPYAGRRRRGLRAPR